MAEERWRQGRHCWLQILHSEKPSLQGKAAEISLQLLNTADDLYSPAGFKQYKNRTAKIAIGTSREHKGTATGNSFHDQFFAAVRDAIRAGQLPGQLKLSLRKGPDISWYGNLVVAWDLTSGDQFALHYNRDILGINNAPRPVSADRIDEEKTKYWDFYIAIGY